MCCHFSSLVLKMVLSIDIFMGIDIEVEILVLLCLSMNEGRLIEQVTE